MGLEAKFEVEMFVFSRALGSTAAETDPDAHVSSMSVLQHCMRLDEA